MPISRWGAWDDPAAPASGGPTLYSVDLTPQNEVVSDYGDGETIAGGMFDGLVVRNGFTSITDDGSECVLTVPAGAGQASPSGWGLPMIEITPDPCMGDWECIIKARGETGPCYPFFFVACESAYGVNNASQGLIGGAGWWNSGNWKHWIRAIDNAGTQSGNGSAYSNSTSRWMRLQSINGTITLSTGGTGVSPSWSTDMTSYRGWHGSVFRVFLGFGNEDGGSSRYVAVEALSFRAYTAEALP